MKRLVLFVCLSFLPIAKAHAIDLSGTLWEITGPLKQHFSFNPEGQLSGFAGCNRFFASYQIDDIKTTDRKNRGKIKIGPIASTKKACQQSVMKAEARLFENLENARSFEHLVSSLQLRDENGLELLSLSRRTGK